MQNLATLMILGFKHYPEWDNKETESKHYRLELNGKVFRATVWDKKIGYPGKLSFVTLGIVVRDNHIVDRWRDCCSNGSVTRKINKEITPELFCSSCNKKWNGIFCFDCEYETI